MLISTQMVVETIWELMEVVALAVLIQTFLVVKLLVYQIAQVKYVVKMTAVEVFVQTVQQDKLAIQQHGFASQPLVLQTAQGRLVDLMDVVGAAANVVMMSRV